LQCNWKNAVERPVEQVRDGRAAVLDIVCNSAGATTEMKPETQSVQMPEHLERDHTEVPAGIAGSLDWHNEIFLIFGDNGGDDGVIGARGQIICP
jgi:hypothetical protein